jgi:hypothetical protein
VLGQLAGVNDTGDPERAPEGAAPMGQREASRVRVQVCTPTRQPTGRVGPEDVTTLTADRDDP